MPVRIASGSELKKIRTFIRSDGTLTTPEEVFTRKRPNVFQAGNSSEVEGRKGEETPPQVTQ